MKLTKLSLVAALLVGTSAFAIENIKVAGDAKLFYSTDDSGAGFFNKDTAFGQAELGLGLSADLTEGVSAGTHLTVLSTLGLEGQLVNGVWEGTNGVSDYFWMDEAWIAGTAGKTTGKIGRMQLDTPLVFSETWSIATNTFEAAVVINQDLPDTTLVGAYVGGSNGGDGSGTVLGAVNANGTTNFRQFYNGAYAAGLVNNSWAPLTAQAWYYEATKVGTAYWVQADLNMEGILAGVQYTGIDLGTSSSAVAAMIGYEMKDTFTAKLSYSMVDDAAAAGFNLSGSGQSKLYTEAWWMYGTITQADTTAMNLTIEAPVAGIDLGLYATMASNDTTNVDLTEVTLSASKSYGPLDTSVVVIMVDSDANADPVNSLQAYLTYNF
jgi:hypothetical protein